MKRQARAAALVSMISTFMLGTLGTVGTTVEAANLRDETVTAWRLYVDRTEARIASELETGEGFLIQDALPAAQAREARRTLHSGTGLHEKARNEGCARTTHRNPERHGPPLDGERFHSGRRAR